MIFADVIAKARNLLAEPDPTGRFSDLELTTYVITAQDWFCLTLEWPEGTITQTATASQPEYALPLILKILRVSVAGQLCVPTTIPVLEGDALEIYDQSTSGTMQPRWQSQPALSYPVAATVDGSPVGQVPWQPNLRPRYYLRGGNLGFVPTPANAALISVDIIPMPPRPPLAPLTTAVSTILPDFMLEPLALKTVEQACLADDRLDKITEVQRELGGWVPKLKTWVGTFQRTNPLRPQPITYRSLQRAIPWR